MATIRTALPAALLAALLAFAPGAATAGTGDQSRGPSRVQDVDLARRVRGLDVTWTKVPGEAVRYVVHKSVDGRPWKRVTATRRTTARVRGLPPVETRIRVRAIRKGTRGPWSKPVAMTPSDPAWVDRRFTTEPVGADLPTGEQCASRVRPAPETRRGNERPNSTRGTDPHDEAASVAGDFTGTTDEIFQWVACKWGIDEDLVRAQAMAESAWDQRARGDYRLAKKYCHPSLRTERPCPMSVGAFQIAYWYHPSAFEDRNAIRSTAYNADYAFWHWRKCYDGEMTWLNDYERGRRYKAGNPLGCVGVWNAGRWFNDDAKSYIGWVRRNLRQRTWEQLRYDVSFPTGRTMTADVDLNERPIL